MKVNNDNDDLQGVIQKLTEENELKTKWISLLVHDTKSLMSTFSWLANAFESKLISDEMVLNMLPEINQQLQINKHSFLGTTEWINRQLAGDPPAASLIDLHMLFSELKAELKRELEHKQIEIHFTGDNALQIKKDKFLLRFVLKEIISNAIKYSHAGGVITCHTSNGPLGVQIRIEDQGIGMNAKVLSNLFTFNGSPYTGTQQEKGAGLSLVIVKQFMQSLTGEIKVGSEEGKGTFFELLFPLAYD